MPISRSVRITRTAISPRLAIRTLRNISQNCSSGHGPLVAPAVLPVWPRVRSPAARPPALRSTLLELRGLFMALDSIEGSLKERGVRLTRQRQILLELIDKTGEHLDAERLYELAKEKDPKLNRVTVYR